MYYNVDIELYTYSLRGLANSYFDMHSTYHCAPLSVYIARALRVQSMKEYIQRYKHIHTRVCIHIYYRPAAGGGGGGLTSHVDPLPRRSCVSTRSISSTHAPARDLHILPLPYRGVVQASRSALLNAYVYTKKEHRR